MDCCSFLTLFRMRNAVNEQLTLVENTFKEDEPPKEPSSWDNFTGKVQDWWDGNKKRKSDATLAKSRENRERLRGKYKKRQQHKSTCKTQ